MKNGGYPTGEYRFCVSKVGLKALIGSDGLGQKPIDGRLKPAE